VSYKIKKKFISHAPEETISIGKKLANSCKGESVLLLQGKLGVGKTCLTKGIALGLGINDLITSPSYNLMNRYDSDEMTLFHIDLYRLETDDDLITFELEEYRTSHSVIVIEWGERIIEQLMFPFTMIEIKMIGENKRQITRSLFGK